MKSSRGFTLVEVIISIGALGIICAVLLRLFVLAGSANEMTADKQAAGMIVASATETLLCADTLQDGVDALGAGPIADEQYLFEAEGYEVHVRATPRGDYPGALYDICVQAMRDGSAIAKISTAKYYPEENSG